MGWDCGGVHTKANPFKDEGQPILNTNQAVEGCFRDIGYERKTWGSLKTEIEGTIFKLLPMFALKAAILPMSEQQFLKKYKDM